MVLGEKLQEADKEIENKWVYVDGKKMENGMFKRQINPSDVIINTGDTSHTPRCPIPGRWKKVVRDPHLKWLAYWKDSIFGRRKYMNLKYCSSMFDISKFNTARELKINQAEIKQQYTVDFTRSNLMDKQCAIVTYLIDTLALRPGHVKDGEITAPTVGCCTLMVKNVILHEPSCLEFRFTGKALVDYENEVEVENLLNKEDLREKTEEDKLVVYWNSNKEVAIFLNHRRETLDFEEEQARKLSIQICELNASIDQKSELEIQRTHPSDKYYASEAGKLELDIEIEKIMEKIHELSLQEGTIACSQTYRLETLRENYLDPRITVAWCLRHRISVSKVSISFVAVGYGKEI
ncbi:putative DNA topoisomerase [Rosa chinensis]|uniref:DNA topoisomerase n=1 Tax=Rosa chinensis TaxID=74649 RepID=A0A2P6SLC9_ROSCH|nr:putative DNA topoisomerase [Rosa chinensis]